MEAAGTGSVLDYCSKGLRDDDVERVAQQVQLELQKTTHGSAAFMLSSNAFGASGARVRKYVRSLFVVVVVGVIVCVCVCVCVRT